VPQHSPVFIQSALVGSMSQPQHDPHDQAGQRASEFVRLFVRHERRLFAYLLTLLGNAADAEDVLQQTSMILWEKFDTFVPESDFTAWGMKTAYFTAKNSLRKQGRSRVVFSQRMFEAVADRAAAGTAQVDAVHEALAECLDGLVEGDRQLIQQRYEWDVSVQSIARRLARSTHAVYRALSRIHAALFDCVSSRLAAENT